MRTRLNIELSPRKAKNLNYLKKLEGKAVRKAVRILREPVVISSTDRAAKFREEIRQSVMESEKTNKISLLRGVAEAFKRRYLTFLKICKDN